MSVATGEITELLLELRRGDADAEGRLVPLVYGELRRLAGIRMRREAPAHSLQPTALVHEAYLRLIRIKQMDWQSRAHFYAVAATLMRRILVDHARANRASKRGAGVELVSFDDGLNAAPARSPEILALDEALLRLAQWNERQAKVVEMRFFAGMSEEEVGEVLGVSARTVKRDWRLARAWLFKELNS